MTPFAFSKPLIWVLFAFSGFAFLPSKALHYGLLDANQHELMAAMGWAEPNISWVWFLALFAFILPKQTACTRRIKGELIGIAGLMLFILASATFYKISLGYAIFVLIIALIALATNNLAELNILRGDRLVISSILCILLLISFFIAYPIIGLFLTAFFDHHSSQPYQAITFLLQPHTLKAIGNSLSVAITVGILSTCFGLAFALYTTKIAKRTVFLSRFMSILPIVTPPFVIGLGVMLMMGRSGYLTQLLVTLFNIPNNWLYGFNGIVIAHTLSLTPIAFMMIEAGLKSIPSTLEEAAYTLGASPYQSLISVLFPLLRPALANTFLVVTVQSLADFGTPLVLGGNYDVIATQIYFYIAGSQPNYVSAGLLGIVLLLLSLLIFLIQYRWIGKRSYVAVSGKAHKKQSHPLPNLIKWGVIGLLLCWGTLNLILYGSIFYGSFTVNWGVDYTLTFSNYIRLFGQGLNDGAFPSLIQTFLFSIVAAPLTVLLGLLIAYITIRREFIGKKTIEFITLLCFAVPGTVAGIAYIFAFNSTPIYLTGTAVIIILSMVMRNIPIGMRAAVAGLKQIDKSLDEASLTLKASSLKTLLFILFPLLKTAILSGLVTSFVRAMTTVSAIIFLVTPDTRVATSYILNRVEDGEYGIAIAYGSILIILMTAIILLFDRLLSKPHK